MLDAALTFLKLHESAFVVLATVVIAISSVASFVVAWLVFKENRLLRKVGTEPQIAAYLLQDKRYKDTLNLVLANIGQGPARRVSFTFDADMEDFAKQRVRVPTRTDRPAIGILPQGERIVTFFGVASELFAGDGLKPFSVKVGYEDIKGRRIEEDFSLDIAQFRSITMLGAPAEHEVAEALKKVAKFVDGWTSGSRRLKVETTTTAEVLAAREEALERLQREQEQHGVEQAGTTGSADEESLQGPDSC